MTDSRRRQLMVRDPEVGMRSEVIAVAPAQGVRTIHNASCQSGAPSCLCTTTSPAVARALVGLLKCILVAGIAAQLPLYLHQWIGQRMGYENNTWRRAESLEEWMIEVRARAKTSYPPLNDQQRTLRHLARRRSPIASLESYLPARSQPNTRKARHRPASHTRPRACGHRRRSGVCPPC